MERVIVFYKNLFSENRKWFRKVLVWFLIVVTVGAVVYFVRPQLLEDILKIFDEKFGPDPALDFDLVLGIFFNNLIVSAIALFGGLLFGLGPFLVVASNGFLLGFMATSVLAQSKGNLAEGFLLLALGLVPHGIIEVPAFLVAAAIGLRLGINWISQESKGQRREVFKKDFKYALLVIPSLALLFFIAAWIEVYVTGSLVGYG